MTDNHGPTIWARRVAQLAAAGLVLTLGATACGNQTGGQVARDTSAQGAAETQRPAAVGVEPQQFTPVVASTLGATTAPVKGTDGRYHVVYELQLTNAKSIPATVRRVVVLDGEDRNRVVGRYQGRRLVQNLQTLATAPVDDATIEPSGSRLLFLDLVFDTRDEVPETLIHRLRVLGPDNPGATEATRLVYTITPFEIGDNAPVVVGPPLEGDGWVAANGCC
jgi:hypothetical protein